MRFTVASTVLLLLLIPPTARCLSSHEETVDAAGIAQLEQRAEHAEAREKAFLYSELLQIYTEMAGKQIADGQIDEANATLKRISQCAEMIHGSLSKNAKKLKDAEMRMHLATYRLGQYMHQTSSDETPIGEATLKQVNKVHDELLTQVFAH